MTAMMHCQGSRLEPLCFYVSVTGAAPDITHLIERKIIAGSLESANSSILAARRHFKEVVGKKNQDFMIMSLVNPSNLIGCGGDI